MSKLTHSAVTPNRLVGARKRYSRSQENGIILSPGTKPKSRDVNRAHNRIASANAASQHAMTTGPKKKKKKRTTLRQA